MSQNYEFPEARGWQQKNPHKTNSNSNKYKNTPKKEKTPNQTKTSQQNKTKCKQTNKQKSNYQTH